MKKKDLEQLIDLAKCVRRVFERITTKNIKARQDLINFIDPAEKELINFINSYNNSNLAGLCERASIQLFLLAQQFKIPVEIGINFSHMFILLEDTVIDITATQFGKRRKVVVGKLTTLQQYQCVNTLYNPWTPCFRYSSLRKLYKEWGRLGAQSGSDRKAVLKELNK